MLVDNNDMEDGEYSRSMLRPGCLNLEDILEGAEWQQCTAEC